MKGDPEHRLSSLQSSRNNSRSRDPTLHHSCGIGKDIDVRSLPPFAMGHGQDHWRLRRTDGKTEILRTQTTSGKERSYIVFWARKVLIPTVQTCIIHILNRLAAILLTRVTRGFACPFRHQELKGVRFRLIESRPDEISMPKFSWYRWREFCPGR
ncbi:Hypothetical protein NTJ_16162 [Nesidiocoris tenuis]|uniref:Uncharacterized protein n=1 Tax=Nesidiocoris tenuis TaxID=355587 RepID=A0ABN7BGD7_9HEMI|nr:Hypothetical protein NTJ_16162 [Nesidiocoris tenuis]